MEEERLIGCLSVARQQRKGEEHGGIPAPRAINQAPPRRVGGKTT